MTLPLFRVRSLMLAVAVVGVLLAGLSLWRRHVVFSRLAAVYEKPDALQWGISWKGVETASALADRQHDAVRAEQERRRRLAAIYRYAASHPWLSLPAAARAQE
jgi:hypothetical protein